jgi:DNA-binding NarL/FixJ family response regulator
METEAERSIGILIVDDHAVLRAGLRMIFDGQPGLRVVGEAASRAEALSAARARQPDIILLDLALGDERGAALVPELLEVVPDARVIAMTSLRDTEAHRQAVMMGAMGLVFKEQKIDNVLNAIAAVHAGDIWIERAVIASVLNARSVPARPPERNGEASRIEALTDREREVIRLIGEGLKNKQIADRLVISEATVRHHLTSIFAKLDVEDRFELVVYAYRHDLASVPR